MSQQGALGKRIILTPDQLRRLLGHDRSLSKTSGEQQRSALDSATKEVARIGPTQAYAQFAGAQERHLHHAANERSAPLVMSVAGPESAAPVAPAVEEENEATAKKKKERKTRAKRQDPKEPTRKVKTGRVARKEEFVISPLKTRGQRQKKKYSPWLQFGEI